MANIERKDVDKSSLKGIPIVWVLGKAIIGKYFCKAENYFSKK